MNPGPLFSTSDLSATMNLNGQVGVGQIGFAVRRLCIRATVDLKNVNLAITQQVSGTPPSNIGQSASLNIDSNSKSDGLRPFRGEGSRPRHLRAGVRQ